MALDHTLVGTVHGPRPRTWTADDALLYAISVGAGQNPGDDLELTTENSQGVAQKVLPTFATVLGMVPGLRPKLGDYDPAMLVHAEVEVEVHTSLPVAGTALVTAEVLGMHDKGSGALVTTRIRAEDDHGNPYFATTSSVFIRGEGGFGGDRGPRATWSLPTRPPDAVVRQATRPEQALLYRLNGDRNPLHSDPAVAGRAGFERPILHGLCTFGFAGRAVIDAVCDGDVDRVGMLGARFSAVVLPGDELVTSIWRDDDLTRFRTARGDGTVVLDHGRFCQRGTDAS